MTASDKESSSRKLSRKKTRPKQLGPDSPDSIEERDSSLATSDGGSSDDAALFLLAKEAVHRAQANNPADVEARRRKVEALKKALAEGSYSADARAVAEKVLEEHLDRDFGKNRL